MRSHAAIIAATLIGGSVIGNASPGAAAGAGPPLRAVAWVCKVHADGRLTVIVSEAKGGSESGGSIDVMKGGKLLSHTMFTFGKPASVCLYPDRYGVVIHTSMSTLSDKGVVVRAHKITKIAVRVR